MLPRAAEKHHREGEEADETPLKKRLTNNKKNSSFYTKLLKVPLWAPWNPTAVPQICELPENQDLYSPLHPAQTVSLTFPLPSLETPIPTNKRL